MKRRERDLRHLAATYGFDLRRRGHHFGFFLDGALVAVASASGSDVRGDRNLVATLRRIEQPGIDRATAATAAGR